MLMLKKKWPRPVARQKRGRVCGASGLDGHGAIFVVAVALYDLRFHVLGTGADRREGVEHGGRYGRE